jgi:hypothetical protein
MSTSPSWFDQEKFSRLVKKVGPKPAPETAPVQPRAEPENRPASPALGVSGSQPISLEKARNAHEGFSPAEYLQASTAHISLVSKPPSLLSEHRGLPTLPRRTATLPPLKSLFQSPPPPLRAPFPGQTPVDSAASSDTGGEENQTESDKVASPDAPAGNGHDLSEVWQKMAQLNEELAHTILERDLAVNEGVVLREQLRQADEVMEKRENGEGGTAAPEEIERLTKEREQAQQEANDLREQLRKAQEAAKEQQAPDAANKELLLLTEERDQARREYAKIRAQFETLKQESPKEDSTKFRKELEQQLEGFRMKLEERNREIAILKANPSSGGAGAGSGETDEKAKEEFTALREQLTRAKEEASIAQRGLALSQKALRETRDTLREATEGTSLSRHNFDNLKSECATLVQQNTVLQAQNEQLLRDLSAAKSKLTTRL